MNLGKHFTKNLKNQVIFALFHFVLAKKKESHLNYLNYYKHAMKQ
jgi:hypothetical protein